jgi:hypothetical protein
MTLGIPDPFEPRSPSLSAEQLNALLNEVKRLSNLRVEPPLEANQGAGVTSIRIVPTTIVARLMDDEGSWVECRPDGGGGWVEFGRVGNSANNPAYNVTGEPNVQGDLVRLYPGLNDEYYYWKSLNTATDLPSPEAYLCLSGYGLIGGYRAYNAIPGIFDPANIPPGFVDSDDSVYLIDLNNVELVPGNDYLGVPFGKYGQQVDTITLITAGSGYSSAPNVIFSGGGGSGAAATCSVSGGLVQNLTLTYGGNDYTSAPDVSFDGGGGSDAAAVCTINSTDSKTVVATVQEACVCHVDSKSSFTGFYNVTPQYYSGGWNNTHTLTALMTECNTNTLVVGSRYIGLVQGFSSSGGASATCTITSGAVATVGVTNTGAGYTSPPDVAFSGCGGTLATATAVLAGSGVGSIAITSPGMGYTCPPSVTITGGKPRIFVTQYTPSVASGGCTTKTVVTGVTCVSGTLVVTDTIISFYGC